MYSFPTIGAAFNTLKIPINEKNIELQVFDCAGSDRFNTLLPIYLRGVYYCILIYSVDDLDSQKSILARWAEYIQEHNITHLYIVGNKIDLGFHDTHTEFLEKVRECFNPDIVQVKYYLTSAKTGEGIYNLFTQIAEDVYLLNVESLPDDVINDSPIVLETKKWYKNLKCW